jgi:hypothetical protein
MHRRTSCRTGKLERSGLKRVHWKNCIYPPVQGYYFSKPIAADDFATLMATHLGLSRVSAEGY